MGKTYRKEKQYKRAREVEEGTARRVDHDHARTNRRKQLRSVADHWQDPAEDLDDLIDLD